MNGFPNNLLMQVLSRTGKIEKTKFSSVNCSRMFCIERDKEIAEILTLGDFSVLCPPFGLWLRLYQEIIQA
jgi:hypothetical protein